MSIAYIPARHFRTLLQLLSEQGLPVAPIMASAGLVGDFMQQKQEGFLSLEQVQSLIVEAVALSHCQCLGVYLGPRLNLSAHGVVGFAGLSAATIGDALQVAKRFQPLVMPLIELRIDKQPDHTWVTTPHCRCRKRWRSSCWMPCCRPFIPRVTTCIWAPSQM